MTLQDVLNADLGTVWSWVRQGATWWRAELEAMLPASWRGRLGAGRPVVERLVDGRWALRREGARPVPLDSPFLEKLRSVDLALPWTELLTRDLDLPLLDAGDLQRLLALDLERLTSFRPEDAWWTSKVIERRAEARRQTVRLVLIRRARADALLAEALAAGLEVRRLGVGGDARGLAFAFDRNGAGAFGRSARRRLLILRVAVAALLLANLLSLLAKDMIATAQLRAAVDARHTETLAVQRLRRRVMAESARRQDLADKLRRQDPLRVLNAVTLALPAGAWVQRFEWNGQVARIAGFAAPGTDPAQALRRIPLFADVRSLPATEAKSEDKAAFDLAAQVRPAATASR